jgi:hypothetical protein
MATLTFKLIDWHFLPPFVYVLRGAAGIEPAPTISSCPVGEPSQRLLGMKGLSPQDLF